MPLTHSGPIGQLRTVGGNLTCLAFSHGVALMSTHSRFNQTSGWLSACAVALALSAPASGRADDAVAPAGDAPPVVINPVEVTPVEAQPVDAAPPVSPTVIAPIAESEWVIVIRPQVDSQVFASVGDSAPVPVLAPAAEPSAIAGPAMVGNVTSGPIISAGCCGQTPRMSYAQALAEIGFSRAEYEANPAYRHETAIELMSGQLRPTTVVKQTVPYFSRYPDTFRLRNAVFPYQGGMSDNTINLRHYWYQQWYW
jgi:hypothetical protein